MRRQISWWNLRAQRRERQRVALVELIRWAQSDEVGRPAGPTTDAATVATRIFETGRVKVRLS